MQHKKQCSNLFTLVAEMRAIHACLQRIQHLITAGPIEDWLAEATFNIHPRPKQKKFKRVWLETQSLYWNLQRQCSVSILGIPREGNGKADAPAKLARVGRQDGWTRWDDLGIAL